MKGTVILKVSGNKVSNDNYTAYVMRQTVNENITSNNSLFTTISKINHY